MHNNSVSKTANYIWDTLEEVSSSCLHFNVTTPGGMLLVCMKFLLFLKIDSCLTVFLRLPEYQSPKFSKCLRVVAFAHPYLFDNIPLFYRVRLLRPSSPGATLTTTIGCMFSSRFSRPQTQFNDSLGFESNVFVCMYIKRLEPWIFFDWKKSIHISIKPFMTNCNIWCIFFQLFNHVFFVPFQKHSKYDILILLNDRKYFVMPIRNIKDSLAWNHHWKNILFQLNNYTGYRKPWTTCTDKNPNDLVNIYVMIF